MEAPWQAEVNRRKEHQPKGFFRGRFTAAVGGDEKWQDIFKLMDVNGEHVENIWENHYEWIRVGFVSDSCRIRVGFVSDVSKASQGKSSANSGLSIAIFISLIWGQMTHRNPQAD